MKKHRHINLTVALLLIIGALSLKAQDIHYSQFWNAPLELNPALAGISSADMRFFAAYKNQWSSVPVGYTTYSAAFDKKWNKFKNNQEQFGFGFMFHQDQAGDSDLSLTYINGMFSYVRKLTTGVYASVGGQLGIGQRTFEMQNLTFDNQYNGEFFDPRENTGETFLDTKQMFFDSRVGLNIRLQRDKIKPKQRPTDFDEKIDTRTKLDIGIGIHHLNKPSLSFYESSNIDIPVRYDIYGIGVLKLTEKFDILGNGLLRKQAQYEEILLGTALRIHLNQKRTKELSLDLGLNIRVGDAAIPFVGLAYRNQWRAGLVFDVNTSPFNSATNSNGGPEFTLMYMFTNPKTPLRKLCPLF